MLARIRLGDYRAHDTVVVDNECPASRTKTLLVVGSVRPAGIVVGPIAEKRKIDAELIGKRSRSERSVDADAQNLGIGLRELVFQIAKAGKLVCSATSEGQWVEGDNYRLAIQSIVERDGVAATVR
jgi:hypothetical protein